MKLLSASHMSGGYGGADILSGCSIEVDRGEISVIVGPNGAGKSTLLRMIGGLGRPDDGSIEVQGRVGCLLDLGTGFHPELTGRENVYINGVVSGLTYREVRQRFDSIVDFRSEWFVSVSHNMKLSKS